MLDRVIEDEGLSLAPFGGYAPDSQAAIGRHDESEMTAQHLIGVPAVRSDPGSGLEPGEASGSHAWNVFDQFRSVGAKRAVRRQLAAEGIQAENIPPAFVKELLRPRHERGGRKTIQLGSYFVPVGFEHRRERKLFLVVKHGVTVPCDPSGT